jgi:hypothetical protein
VRIRVIGIENDDIGHFASVIRGTDDEGKAIAEKKPTRHSRPNPDSVDGIDPSRDLINGMQKALIHSFFEGSGKCELIPWQTRRLTAFQLPSCDLRFNPNSFAFYIQISQIKTGTRDSLKIQ